MDRQPDPLAPLFAVLDDCGALAARLLAALLAVVLLALLLLGPRAAQAQAPALPACWSAEVPGATGTEAVFRQDATHRALVWACCDAFACRRQGFAGPRSAFASDWLMQAQALRFGGADGLGAAWRRFVTAPTIKPGQVAALDAAFAELATRLPPLPVYVVARNAARPDRPAYAFDAGAGARSRDAAGRPLEAGRAPVLDAAGAPVRCDCATRAVEGGSVYCAFDADRARVALCSRATP